MLLGHGACAQRPEDRPPPKWTRRPARVVALGQGPDADTLLALGLVPVGMSATIEQIAALHPDLIVGTEFRRRSRTAGGPQVLELVELGDDPLHLDAGPAPAVGPLRAAAHRLTVAQLDPAFGPELSERWAASRRLT